MNDIYTVLVDKFIVFLLVLVRMSALFVITPIFGRKSLPNYLKIGLAFFCTFALVPLLGDINIEFINIYYYTGIIVKEFLVGIVIGYVSFMFFSSLYLAGQIIDMQIGFGMVNILDPINGIQVPLLGNFMYTFVTLYFLLINGHHILLSALFKSYSLVPINGAVFDNFMVSNIIKMFIEAFALGFKISTPILAAALLAEVSLGILAKTVPQMNVFVVGMPVKIGLGLLTFMVVFPLLFGFMDVTFDKMYSYIYLIIKNMMNTTVYII